MEFGGLGEKRSRRVFIDRIGKSRAFVITLTLGAAFQDSFVNKPSIHLDSGYHVCKFCRESVTPRYASNLPPLPILFVRKMDDRQVDLPKDDRLFK